MSEIRIIVEREFVERVRTKSFLLGTVFFPAFLTAMFTVPMLIGMGGGGEHTIALVDEAPAGIADRVAERLEARAGESDATYTVERVAAPLDAVRDELTARVQRKEIDGFLWLAPDVVEASRVKYRAHNVSNFSVLRDLRRATTEAVQAERLRRSGLDVAEVAALVRSVDIQSARITERGTEGGGAETTFRLAYIIAFLTYMLIVLYGANVMRSVIEEKTNRIAEVIASSVRSVNLMIGKIVGVGSVALFQVAIWFAFAGIVMSQSSLLEQRFGLSTEMLGALRIEPLAGATLLAFFLLGFFLYAAVFAALGAAVNSEQEAQQLTIVPILPLIVPLLLMPRIGSDPLGSLATITGLVPFTSPVVMPMRLAAVGVPTSEVVGSLAILAATVLLVAWVAGKIYRVGILATGKRPSLRELGRWLRAA